jgi:hypothetical protein
MAAVSTASPAKAWSQLPKVRFGDGGPLTPLGDRRRVHPVASRQLPQARLTMLDRATDHLSRGCAPVENLADGASLHACEKTAPSKPGINHLACRTEFECEQ